MVPAPGAPQVHYPFRRNQVFASKKGETEEDGIKRHLEKAAAHLEHTARCLEEFNAALLEEVDSDAPGLLTLEETRKGARDFKAYSPSLSELLRARPEPVMEELAATVPATGTPDHALFAIQLQRSRISTIEAVVSDDVERMLQLLFVLVGGAAVLLHLYGHSGHWHQSVVQLLLLGVLSLAGIAVLANIFFRRRRSEVRALDWRAVSEGLRIQFAWAASGLPDSVAACYLHRFRSELDWVRNAISAWTFPHERWQTFFDAQPPAEQLRRLRATRAGWIRSQERYYQKSFHKKHGKGHRHHRHSFWSSIAGVVLIAVLLACEIRWHHFAHEHDPAHMTLLIAAGFLLLYGGLRLAYSEKSLNPEHARRYEGMAHLMESAGARITTILDEAQALLSQDGSLDSQHRDPFDSKIKQAQKLLAALGREALTENAEWLLLHRARPVEVPTAG